MQVSACRYRLQFNNRKTLYGRFFYSPGDGFSNVFWEILFYEELLKHKFYLILRTFVCVSSFNNIIKCRSNWAWYILTYDFLKLCEIWVSKVSLKIRSPINCLRIRPQEHGRLLANQWQRCNADWFYCYEIMNGCNVDWFYWH